jgi:hypothetical protein
VFANSASLPWLKYDTNTDTLDVTVILILTLPRSADKHQSGKRNRTPLWSFDSEKMHMSFHL